MDPNITSELEDYVEPSCLEIDYKNPILLYVVLAILVCILSALSVLYNFSITKLIFLPFKILINIIWIIIFTICLLISCNYFTLTITWILSVLFILFTTIGTGTTIFLGTGFLIVMYVIGIPLSFITGITYYYRDYVLKYFDNTQEPTTNPTTTNPTTTTTNPTPTNNPIIIN